MSEGYKIWQKCFLFCLGIFLSAAFCMKWMEGDFIQAGKKFTIIGLEISYSQQQVSQILSGLDDKVKTILQYHLYFDFAFMAGVYPGIFALCMMARRKTENRFFRTLLLTMAFLQPAALLCDIMENCFLLQWINTGGVVDKFSLYHLVVYTKWILALSGALIAIPLNLIKQKKQ